MYPPDPVKQAARFGRSLKPGPRAPTAKEIMAMDPDERRAIRSAQYRARKEARKASLAKTLESHAIAESAWGKERD
jgi:hypothetical protein